MITKDQSFAFSSVDTGTMHDLAAASWKLSNEASRKWAYFDASVAYLETTLFSLIRLVKHLALSCLAVTTLWSESGRNYFLANASRMAIDFSGAFIGALGIIYPYGAEAATAKLVLTLNSNVLNFGVISKKELQGAKFAAPVVIGQFENNFLKVCYDQAIEGYAKNELAIALKG